MDKPLWGLKVDGPLGRRFLRGLSLTAALPLRVVVGASNYIRRPLMIKRLSPEGKQADLAPQAQLYFPLQNAYHAILYSKVIP